MDIGHLVGLGVGLRAEIRSRDLINFCPVCEVSFLSLYFWVEGTLDCYPGLSHVGIL